MNPEQIERLFLRSLELVDIDHNNRMQLLPARTLNTMAGLTGLVADRPEDTVINCALVRLGAATGGVITTILVDDPTGNAQIVSEWKSALSEYLQLAGPQ